MTLTQLKYILAVERCRNFAQAARECFVTQPTLSMQIAKLEDYLQVIIFDRSVNPVRPTALGKKFLEKAREVIHRADALEEMAKGLRKEVMGEFNLAVIPTLAPYLLPLFVENFRTKYPKVQLRLFEYQTDEIISYLKEDKIDAAILATPLEVNGIIEEVLFYEPFQMLFSPKHPMLENKEVKESELKIEEAWLLKEGHCMRSQALQLCAPSKGAIERAVFFEGGSIETLVNLLNTMHGFTVVPELSVPHFNLSTQKRLRPFRGKRPVREISMITGPFALKESISSAIKKTILESVPEHVLAETKKDVIIEIS